MADAYRQPTKKTPEPFGKGVLFVKPDVTGKTGGSKRLPSEITLYPALGILCTQIAPAVSHQG
jgi:hypothetical protein